MRIQARHHESQPHGDLIIQEPIIPISFSSKLPPSQFLNVLNNPNLWLVLVVWSWPWEDWNEILARHHKSQTHGGLIIKATAVLVSLGLKQPPSHLSSVLNDLTFWLTLLVVLASGDLERGFGQGAAITPQPDVGSPWGRLF